MSTCSLCGSEIAVIDECDDGYFCEACGSYFYDVEEG